MDQNAERKSPIFSQSEESLRLDQKRYYGLLSNLDVGVVIHSIDTSILLNNKRAEELLGMSSDQMRGMKSNNSHWNFILEDNTICPQELFPVVRVATTKKSFKNQILGINRPNTSDTIWVSVNGFPILNKENQISEIVINFIDITDQKKLEIQLQQSYNEVLQRQFAIDQHAIVAITDYHGKITYANDLFCAISKYKAEDLIGKDHRILNSGYHSKVFFKDLYLTIMKGAVWHGEIKNKAKDGSYYWVTSTIVPLNDAVTKKVSYVSISTNITERKWAEKVLNKYMHELEEMNQAKDKFFSIIAHDLRNPFVGIMGVTDLLLERMQEDENKQFFSPYEHYIKMIQTASKSAHALLENLMNWAKLQRNDISYSPEKISFKKILNSCVMLVTGNAFTKNIAIEVNYQDEDTVYADESHLNTIVRNLLTNAIKFTNSNGRIIVSASKKDAYLEIAVRDTGIGISRQNVDKIFRIDSKFSQIGTANEKGTGLGLILCKDFVEKQGGKIWVESEVGKGSTFTFTLPLAN